GQRVPGLEVRRPGGGAGRVAAGADVFLRPGEWGAGVFGHPLRGAAGARGAASLGWPPMVAPQLDTEHPGIRVIAEVASVLQAGSASGVALRGVVAARRRGLNLRRCRLWLRTPDGTRYAPVTTPGGEAELPGSAPPVSDWVRQGPHREGAAGGSVLRLPLIHEDEPLGALEVIIPSGRYEGVAHDVVVVVARILAPMIAATELSQDLASEV